jgi:hypothetical protein
MSRMDHSITTVTTVWKVATPAGEIFNKLYEFSKTLKDRDAEKHVDEMLDELRELKNSAVRLEDENRYLREKLRFKSDQYVFRTPFRYHLDRPEQALCVKCFSKDIEAPMGEQGYNCARDYRQCLVCKDNVQVSITVTDTPILRTDFPRG